MQIFVIIVLTFGAVNVACVHDVTDDINGTPPRISLPYGAPLKIYSSTKGDLSLQYACKDGRVSACKCLEYISTKYRSNTNTTESKEEDLEEFSHLAFVGSKTSSSMCGGSLISPLYVLTIGSCIMKHNNQPEFVTVGGLNPDKSKSSLSKNEKAGIQIPVGEIYKESGLISAVKVNDFIILGLVFEAPLSANIRPACLWTMTEIERETKLMVSSLQSIPGKDSNSYAMHKSLVSIVNGAECNSLNNNESPRDQLLNDICVQETAENKLSSCEDRMGSPLQFVTQNHDTITTYLVAMNTISDDSCNNELSLFTKVARSVDWIESVVWPGVSNHFGDLDVELPNVSFAYVPPVKISSPTKDSRIQNACNEGRVSACKCIEYTRGTQCKKSYNYMDSSLFDETELGEFPHLVSVGRNTTNVYEIVSCSGSLISSRFVLTTGGCLIEHANKPQFVSFAEPGPDFPVKGGTTSIRVPIKKIHRQKKPEAIVNFNEIILLELASEVSFSTNIRPACLWTEKSVNKKAKYLVAGLEHLQGHVSNIGIRKASASIVQETQCNSTYGFHISYFEERLINKNRNICVWETPVDDLSYRSCKVIAGSPMQTVTQDENSCIFNILAMNIAFDHFCSGRTSLYTTVPRDIEWIERVVWRGDSNKL